MTKKQEAQPISRVSWVIITAFVGSLIASNAVLISDNSETKTRLSDVTKSVDRNSRSIAAIEKQTQILLSIKTGLGYVIEENKKSNKYLRKLSVNQTATALEQAKRKTIVYDSAKHMRDWRLHSK